MTPVLTFCFKHSAWGCSVCGQKKQQRSEETIAKPVAPPRTIPAASTSNAASSSSSLTCLYCPKESANSTPPISSSACPYRALPLPVSTASTSSESEASQQRVKRKISDFDDDIIVSPANPCKRIKVSMKTTDYCSVAAEVFRGLNNRFPNSEKVLTWAVQPDDPDFLRIHQYVANSQAPGSPIKILAILRIMTPTDKLKNGAPMSFNEYPDAGDMHRMMLWHGTKRGNVSSILENGFRVPNYGTFFADRVAKSSHYCTHTQGVGKSEGYLFLCDVLLGKKGHWAQSSFDEISSRSIVGNIDCHSEKVCGKTIPNRKMDIEVNGCVWPLGSNAGTWDGRSWLWALLDPKYRRAFNDYIVYAAAQIQPKFLIKVEF